MSNKKTSLILRVEAETKDKFDAYCKGQGLSVSEVLRQFMEDKVGSSHSTGAPLPSESRWKVVNTRLTDSEYRSMSVRVNAEKTTNSKWLLSLIRERIIQAPQLRAEEIQSISMALFRLQSVGRNLNQLVKHLNTTPHLVKVLPAIDALALRSSIQETTTSIGRLIQAATVRDYENV